jgi:hypothetical protein
VEEDLGGLLTLQGAEGGGGLAGLGADAGGDAWREYVSRRGQLVSCDGL